MKRRKIIAGIMAMMLLFTYADVFADIQERLPSDGLDHVTVSHTSNEGSDMITPNAQVSFQKVANIHSNSVTEHNTGFYDIYLTDSLGERVEGLISEAEADKLATDQGTNRPSIKLESYMNDKTAFKNGRLYQLMIQPGHYHVSPDGTTMSKAGLNPSAKDPVKYFVTDLNTIAREVEDDIEVVWEYIPGATYKLVYIPKEATTKAEVDGTENNDSGVGSNTVTLKASEMNVFSEGGIRKVKYTLDDTIPGQKYSAYVIVTGIADSFLKDNWGNVGVNTTTPKIAQATRSIGLNITNIGKNRIELKWDVRSWMTSEIETIKVWRKIEGESNYTLIGTMYNNDLSASDAGRFEHDEPKKNSYYYVEFFVKESKDSIKTKEELYVPFELREQPLKPQVPEPYSDTMNKEELSKNKNDYLVKNDDVTLEKMKDHTFHVKSVSPLQVQLVWDAPMKKNNAGKEVADYGLSYDIWVVERDDMLSDALIEPVIKDFTLEESQDDYLIKTQASKEVVGFKNLLTKYTNKDGVVKNLISNKTYYIKIVAKRNYTGTIVESQPTVVAITIDKNGDIFIPPVLAKPPLRIQENGIKKTEVTIEWLEKWYEIKAKDPSKYSDDADEMFLAKLWNSRVYTGGTLAIKFKADEGLKEHDLITKDALKEVKSLVTSYDGSYEDREVTLGDDIKYEVKSILYDDVISALNAEGSSTTTPSSVRLARWIVENESNTTEGWNTVVPGNEDHKDGLPWKDHTVIGLTPNTRYIIMVRAYRVLDDGQKLIQTFPSYVIATTDSDYKAPEAMPVVPVLNPDGVTDSSISVWWVYNEDFDYEVVYSRLEDPNNATSWPVEISNTIGDKNYVSNGAKASVTITGLMPDTSYNIWIRAKQKVGDKVSSWSNPVTQTTLNLGTPDVPRGLGPAAYDSILEIGQDFAPVNEEYITVEWIKDANDVEGADNVAKSQKTYSYVVEFADNPEFLDSTLVTSSGASEEGEGNYSILAKNMIKFTNLEANKPYYVRVKTVLTFIDEETGRKIIKESDFCTMVRILTKTSNNEYDGGENDNVVIYPNAIEESFKNNIWTMEIVDTAKVITEILSQKKYYFTITMEEYNDKYDVGTRCLRMPKSVLDALINQSMELRIVTKIGVYEIPARALNYYAKQHSATDTVQFELTKATNAEFYTILRSYPEMLVNGEQLEISLKGTNKLTTVKKIDGYLKVKLKLDVDKSYLYKDFHTYTYRFDPGSWTKESYIIETLTDSYMTYKTAYTGLYALYEKAVGSTNRISYNMSKLANKYGVAGLGSLYFAKDYVQRDQFVQLLVGMAENKSAIELAPSASSELITKARSAGFTVSSQKGAITEEQAIAGVVRLYELKNGYKLKPSNVSFSNVSSNYREAVSKAYAIGLIDNINPQGKVTYSTLCDWLVQVTE